MNAAIRWGILGTGAIAKKFVTGLKSVPDAQIAAIGSRKQDTADAFAKEFGASKAHASYEALASDPEVDAIYVSTPHQLHCVNTLLCLDHGKAVLCEKPFAINTREAQQMVSRAREKKRFLMEAMWTRFLPAMAQARKWIAEGRIGEPRMVMADFGFRGDLNADSRLFAPEYGGGSLLDVGIYPLSFASMIFGGKKPHAITGSAHLGATGVDEQAAYVLTYDAGRLAVLASAVRTETPYDAYVLGTEGRIQLHSPFWCTTKATLKIGENEPTVFEQPHQGNGYEYQAMEVMRCLRAGETESPGMPLAESIVLMETMDVLRAQWGLKYPMD